MLPLYYLQRSRIAEALDAYTALKDNFVGGPGDLAALHINHPVTTVNMASESKHLT